MQIRSEKKLNPHNNFELDIIKKKREREKKKKSEKAKSLKDQSKNKQQQQQQQQKTQTEFTNEALKWSCKWTVCRTERKN